MRTMQILRLLFVFAANILNDCLAVWFVQCVGSGDGLKAGAVSVTIIILHACTLLLVIKSLYFLIPAALGAFLGTILTVGVK